MSRFVKHNQNPEGFKRADCVVRAISFGLNIPYYEVLRDLYEIGVRFVTVQSDPRVYERYLNFDYCAHTDIMGVKYQNAEGLTKRYTVADICSWEGTYIVAVAQHLTVVKDGSLYDIWDCRRKCAYKIWKVTA